MSFASQTSINNHEVYTAEVALLLHVILIITTVIFIIKTFKRSSNKLLKPYVFTISVMLCVYAYIANVDEMYRMSVLGPYFNTTPLFILALFLSSAFTHNNKKRVLISLIFLPLFIFNITTCLQVIIKTQILLLPIYITYRKISTST